MATFTVVVAFLALAASLTALYLVGETVKRVEEETKSRVEEQMRPVKKKLDHAASAILALEEKQGVMQKALTTMVSKLEENANEMSRLGETVDKTQASLTTLERSIPPNTRLRGPQNRSIQ